MSLNAYRIFCTVAEEKSFFKAAEVLFLTPSAVSHSVSMMEEKFGFALFFRDRSGARLTSDGERLLPYIRGVLDSEERLHQEADRVQGFMSGSVRLGAISSICNNWLCRILDTFHDKFPDIQVGIVQGSYEALISSVKNGTVDMAFTSIYANESLMTTPLYLDPLVCITPADYTPVNGKFITREDIVKNNLIAQSESADYDTMSLLISKNMPANPKHRIEDDSTIISMVEHGFGISIIPELVYKGLPSNVNQYPLTGDEHRILGLVMHEKKLLSPAIMQMYNHINDFMREEKLYNL